MADVPGFLPSVNGLRFPNRWPDNARITMRLGPLGRRGIGSATRGLCGGMVFTALDVFTAGLAPLPDPQPPAGSPLFNYIVTRLIDSWHLPMGVLAYYRGMLLPDGDIRIGPITVRGIGRRTVIDEIPRIRDDLDAGRLVPIGLVTVASANPVRLGKNHQVLAYGYHITGDHLTLKVYDPNTTIDRADDARIMVNLAEADPRGTTTISHNVGLDDPIRAFFRVRYTPADPGELITHQDPTAAA